MANKYIKNIIIFLLFIEVSLNSVSAETIGKIGGKITDKNGAVILNLIIEALQEGIVKKTATNNGHYYIFHLPIGIYEIRVSRNGYHAQTKTVEAIDSAYFNSANFILEEYSEEVNSVNLYSFPNPYRLNQSGQFIEIANCPINASIKVFSISGELIKDFVADNYGLAKWDLRNEDKEILASGIYFILIKSGNKQKIIKQVIIK